MNPRPALLRSAGIAAIIATAVVAALRAQTPPPSAKRLPPAGIAIPAAARAELTAGTAALRADLDALTRELTTAKNERLLALLPDVEVFHKAVDWALRYDEFFDAKQIATAKKALATGRDRVAQLRAGKSPWLDATGLIVRGHRSAIDGSFQPYGLFVPAGASRERSNRLMVWLLGRGEKRSELAFIAEREAGPPQLTPRDTIILVPYGRFCNATKFAGETDVFEAMESVRGTYRIDADRITVAGFSMGGASTWHLAAHHAGLWCAASPGAGFAETAIYNRALDPGKPPRTPWEQTLWRWYNATDYAGNFFNQPIIAYSGEIDPQKQSADLMEAAMAKEGLKLERLIGPKTAHKYHPDTKNELTARLETLADQGRDKSPHEVRVTTYTMRYPGRSWAQFEALERHWERADLVARREGTDSVVVSTKNTTAINLALPGIQSVKIDGQTVNFPAPGGRGVFLHRENGAWKAGAPAAAVRKRAGLSGPIDDAFTQSFLFVRPTGKPLNSALAAWTRGEMAHAEKMWRDIFRGNAPVKDDTAISDDDIRSKNLVLWGDPASNQLLARLLAQLPLTWDGRKIVFRGRTYDSAHHTPILVFPNPLNPAHYVVLNSGIDFRDEAYGTNSLQVPKLPDYAIIDLREPPGSRWPGKIVDAGFFDESWK
ncbi:MAG: hypothetical protein EXS37_10735 [Opitutus sp.]|nr:hypothetical protein [Opitutus sp.]